MTRRALHALLALFPVLLSGCVAIAAGAVVGAAALSYTYVKGEGVRTYDATVAQAWNAAIRTCRRMKLDQPRGNPPDAFGGQMTAKRPSDGTPITIRFKSVSRTRTEVGVRVGTFGDEMMSRDFHDYLADELR